MHINPHYRVSMQAYVTAMHSDSIHTCTYISLLYHCMTYCIHVGIYQSYTLRVYIYMQYRTQYMYMCTTWIHSVLYYTLRVYSTEHSIHVYISVLPWSTQIHCIYASIYQSCTLRVYLQYRTQYTCTVEDIKKLTFRNSRTIVYGSICY